MPHLTIQFDQTPNPNALKCITNLQLSPSPRSFFNVDQAQDEPLACALFAISGVTNVLINTNWVTVNKHADTNWNTLKPKIRKVLQNLEKNNHADAQSDTN